MLPLLDATVRSIYGRGVVNDCLGIELEMEGKTPNDMYYKGKDSIYWAFKGDGSLRNNGIEAVSVKLSFVEVPAALAELFENLNADLLSSTSPRTSTHVHINTGHLTMAQVINMYCVYILLEDLLLELSGKTRKGNNFAISSQASDAQYEKVRDCIAHYEPINIQENERYASFNFASLRTLGTVEFRSMRGLTNPEDIQEWVDILVELYHVATSCTNPKELISKNTDYFVLKGLLRYFSFERITDVIKSNISSVMYLAYAHPNNWDSSDDIRATPGFRDWAVKKGYNDRNIYNFDRGNLKSLKARFDKGEPDLKGPDFNYAFVEQMLDGARLDPGRINWGNIWQRVEQARGQWVIADAHFAAPQPEMLIVDEVIDTPLEDVEVI